MRARTTKAALTLVAACALVSFAASQLGAKARAEADQAWFQRDYVAAIEAYRAVLRNDPSDGRSWFRQSFALHNSDRFEEAIPGYEKAIQLNYGVLSSRYNIACCYARLGQKDKALDHLEAAVQAGFSDTTLIKTDADFESVRQMPRFQTLVNRSEDPVGFYEQGSTARRLRGLYRNESVMLVVNETNNGYAKKVDIVQDGKRQAFLLLYFSAPDQGWKVSGTEKGGGVFSGDARFRSDSVELTGKRTVDGGATDLRVKISFDSSTADFMLESRQEEGWVAENSYTLELAGRVGGR